MSSNHVRESKHKKGQQPVKGFAALGEAYENSLSGDSTTTQERKPPQGKTNRERLAESPDVLQAIQEVGNCCNCGRKVFGGFYGRHESSGTCGEKCEKEYAAIQQQRQLLAAIEFEKRFSL